MIGIPLFTCFVVSRHYRDSYCAAAAVVVVVVVVVDVVVVVVSIRPYYMRLSCLDFRNFFQLLPRSNCVQCTLSPSETSRS